MTAGPRTRRLLPPLLLLALAFVLYGPSLPHPFLIDDPIAIETHPDVAESGRWAALWVHDYWAGTTEDRNLYRPITVASFRLNRELLGPRPAAFRAVNVALLAAIGWAFGAWLRGYVSPFAAWAAAAGVVAHPGHAEVIHHVVGRADLLAVAGILGCLLAQRRAIERRRWTAGLALAAGAAAAVALGAKETGLLVVPLAAAQAWVAGRETRFTPQSESGLSPWGGVAALALPLAAYGLGRFVAVGALPRYGPSADDLTGNPLRGLGLTARLPGALAAAWGYARQPFWPRTDFNFVPAVLPAATDPGVLAGAAVLAAAAIGVTVSLRRRSWLAIPLLLAVGQYALVGNLLTPTGAYAAGRLTLPFTLAAAGGLAAALDRLRLRRVPLPTLYAAVALLLGGLSVGAWRTHRPWSDELSRMRADAAAQPDNPVARFNYGSALLTGSEVVGRAGEQAASAKLASAAVAELRRVTAARPDSLQARRQLATALSQAGDLDAAAGEYRVILARQPEDFEANLALGELAMLRPDYAAAERYFLAAERRAPPPPDARGAGLLYNLAELDKARGRYDAALRRYEDLLRREPGHRLGRQQYDELKRYMLGARSDDPHHRGP